MSVATEPGEVTRRLRRLAELADLRPERRLDAKVDRSAAAITLRLRRVSALRAFCVELGRASAGDRSGRRSTHRREARHSHGRMSLTFRQAGRTLRSTNTLLSQSCVRELGREMAHTSACARSPPASHRSSGFPDLSCRGRPRRRVPDPPDLDNTIATGCTANTAAGPFQGIEQVLVTTTTPTGPAAADVTAVAVETCVSGLFGRRWR
jgi:hypothetical protein